MIDYKNNVLRGENMSKKPQRPAARFFLCPSVWTMLLCLVLMVSSTDTSLGPVASEIELSKREAFHHFTTWHSLQPEGQAAQEKDTNMVVSLEPKEPKLEALSSDSNPESPKPVNQISIEENTMNPLETKVGCAVTFSPVEVAILAIGCLLLGLACGLFCRRKGEANYEAFSDPEIWDYPSH
eukprot:g40552.t1